MLFKEARMVMGDGGGMGVGRVEGLLFVNFSWVESLFCDICLIFCQPLYGKL